MVSTVFVPYVTKITASWANDVNGVVYDVLGDGAIVPSTKTELLANLGILSAADNAALYQTIAGMSAFATVASLSAYQTVAGMSAFQTIASLNTTLHAAPFKTVPVTADEFTLTDSASSYALKRMTFGDLSSAVIDLVPATDIAATVHAAPSKATIANDDEFALIDSEASFILKKLTWTNLLATISSAVGAVTSVFGRTGDVVAVLNDYSAVEHAATSIVTPSNNDEIPILDSTDTFNKKKLVWSDLVAALTATVTSVFGRTGAVVADLEDYTAVEHAATGKTVPANNDELMLMDSAALYIKKKLLWSDLVTTVAAAVSGAVTSVFGRTGDVVAVLDDYSSVEHAATSKTTPVDADEIPLLDSAATFNKKKLTWANLVSTISAAVGAVTSVFGRTGAVVAVLDDYSSLEHGATSKTTPVNADELILLDSAASFNKKKLTWANLVANISTSSVGTAIHSAPSKTTPVDADELALVDSAASFTLAKLTWLNLKNGIKAVFSPNTGSSLVGHISDATGATSTTVQADLRFRVVTPKNFGATGDGVTNDTTAVQLAITSGQSVDFGGPENVYVCGALTASTANVKLFGNGAKILKNAAVNQLTLNAANITVKGLQLYGQNNAGSAVKITAASCVVEDCWIQEHPDSGTTPTIDIEGTHGTARNNTVYGSIYVINVDDALVDSNRIYPFVIPSTPYNGVGIQSVTNAANHADNCRVINNYIEIQANSFGISPISRNGAIPPRNVQISGNTVISPSGTNYGGISVDTCGSGVVSNNNFRVIAGSPALGIEIVKSTNFTISGNYVDANSLCANPINLNSSRDCTVVGNKVINPTTSNGGIVLTSPAASNDCSRNVVVGNDVSLAVNTSYGIRIVANNATAVCSNNYIVGNMVYGSGTGQRGVMIDKQNAGATMSGNTVQGNTVVGCDYAVAHSGSTSTLVRNNVGLNIGVLGFHDFAGASASGCLVLENSWQRGTSAPATGEHYVGERWLQSTPTVGQPKGWQCTVTGQPGTWVSEGNL